MQIFSALKGVPDFTILLSNNRNFSVIHAGKDINKYI